MADREDQLWTQIGQAAKPSGEADSRHGGNGGGNDRSRGAAELGAPNGSKSVPYRGAAAGLPHLPAGLCDLEHLACGLSPDGPTPVSTLFEERCAEAFRCLGFEIRKLGQGCGRVADCLAVAAAERFAVVIDAKVRRRGYSLGTDDRQFCEYATRHTRELALSGIEKVYFAVIGRGFRQQDLDKLAGFMSGTPIRGVCFVEAQSLMRLVDRSIRERRQFRLEQIDQLFFGNKIIDK